MNSLQALEINAKTQNKNAKSKTEFKCKTQTKLHKQILKQIRSHIHPTKNKHYTIRQQPNSGKINQHGPYCFTKLVCDNMGGFDLIIFNLQIN